MESLSNIIYNNAVSFVKFIRSKKGRINVYDNGIEFLWVDRNIELQREFVSINDEQYEYYKLAIERVGN